MLCIIGREVGYNQYIGTWVGYTRDIDANTKDLINCGFGSICNGATVSRHWCRKGV